MTSPKVSREAREAAADLVAGIYGQRRADEMLTKAMDNFITRIFAQFEQLIRSMVIDEAAGEQLVPGLVAAVESLIPLIWIAQGDTASAEIVERARAVLFKAKAAHESHRTDDAAEILRMLIAADEEAAPNGIQDCVDNDGHPYQSAAMAGIITHARLIAEPYDHASSIRQLGERGRG